MGVKAGAFFEYMDTFMEYRKDIHEISDQTLKTNLIDLELFKNFVDQEQIRIIDGPATMAFQYYLKHDRDNCGASINRKIFTLKCYAHFLRAMDVPNADNLPFYDVLKIRQGYRNRPNALSIRQVKSLFDSIDRNTVLGIRDYALYALMYQTGLRVGEVHCLNLDNIDFKKNQLSVRGKGNKIRILHLTDEMHQILVEYLAVRDFLHKADESDALFISKKGNRLAIRTMEDNMKKLFFRTKLNTSFNVTCHTLRHSFASHLNDKDVDILVIQSLLGHSSTRSTEPYIHPSMDKIRQAMEKLPSVIYMNTRIQKVLQGIKFQHNRPRKE